MVPPPGATSSPLGSSVCPDDAELASSSSRIDRQSEGSILSSGRCPAGLLDPGHDLLEGPDFALESFDTLASDRDPGLGTSRLVSLFDGHETSALQYVKVSRQIARGELKGFLEEPELDPLSFVGDGEYSQACPLMDDLVKGATRLGHGWAPVL